LRRTAGFQNRWPSAIPLRSKYPRPADLEIGDTAGLATCGTGLVALARLLDACISPAAVAAKKIRRRRTFVRTAAGR